MALQPQLLQRYIKQRGGYRATITKCFNRIDGVAKDETVAELKATKINAMIETIKEEYVRIKECNTLIENFYLDSNEDQSTYENELDQRTQYHSELLSNISTAEGYVKQILGIKKENAIEETTSYHDKHNCSTGKLPDITLPKFNGDILEWAPFWDAFISEVHNNKHMNNIRKFTYLKAHLVGPAMDLIQNMRTTEANYNDVIDILMERYGSKSKAVFAHCEILYNLPLVTDTKQLQQFYDKLEMNFRALAALGLSFDEDSVGIKFIIYHLRCKLSKEIRERISKQIESTEWGLDELQKALKKILEVMEPETMKTQAKSHSKNELPMKGYEKPRFNSTVMTVEADTKKRECTFCGDDQHKAVHCTKLTTQEERYNFVRTNHLCFNCLVSGHSMKDCKSRNVCGRCSKRHHSSLHDTRKQQQNNQVTQVKETVSTTIHSNTVELTNQEILLKTSRVKIPVNDKIYYANLLLDEGSNGSFITSKMTHILQLPIIRSENTRLRPFGVINSIPMSYPIVELKILDRNNQLIPIEAKFTKNITSTRRETTYKDILMLS